MVSQSLVVVRPVNSEVEGGMCSSKGKLST